jgi:thiamine pyrophosphokinase
MRAVIFANGELRDPQGARELLRPTDGSDPPDLVIAADGGTRHALSIGVPPDVVVGDVDSLSPEEQARVEAAGSRIVRFSPRKDETDLELALQYAVHDGATEIVILAALGGRLDQTVANLLLLALPELRGIDVRIVEGAQTAFLIRGHRGRRGREGAAPTSIEGRPGDTVSLIPLGGDAVGVTAEGLEWPLDDDVLRFGPARGVSNVLTAERARVSLRQGLLLCVVTRKGGKSASQANQQICKSANQQVCKSASQRVYK